MRGRLMQRFRAELHRLNTVATAAANHYDDVFKEPIKVSTGDGIGTLQRSEHDVEYIPCQIGNRRWEQLRPTDLGNDAGTNFVLYFHYADLEAEGLIDATTKRPLISVGDRVASIRSYLDPTALVLGFDHPSGLYCVGATPSGWGLNMSNPTVNLLRCEFNSRRSVG